MLLKQRHFTKEQDAYTRTRGKHRHSECCGARRDCRPLCSARSIAPSACFPAIWVFSRREADWGPGGAEGGFLTISKVLRQELVKHQRGVGGPKFPLVDVPLDEPNLPIFPLGTSHLLSPQKGIRTKDGKCPASYPSLLFVAVTHKPSASVCPS